MSSGVSTYILSYNTTAETIQSNHAITRMSRILPTQAGDQPFSSDNDFRVHIIQAIFPGSHDVDNNKSVGNLDYMMAEWGYYSSAVFFLSCQCIVM